MIDFLIQIDISFLSIPLNLLLDGLPMLAIKMTFYPLDFIGIRPFFGWQGIIPSKAVKMSTISVDLWTTKLVSVKDLFEQIDPKKVAKEMRPEFDRISKEIMDEIWKSKLQKLEQIPIPLKK